jgi:GTP-binding protein EngB required for normal cell division
VTADALSRRLQALAEAADLCRGRVDPATVDAACAVVKRADRRLALSGDATVVALAGATGSGKSSLFNALIGVEMATVGVRRPTTSEALACVWGSGSAEELLDWVGVRRRHTLPANDAGDLSGLVLLDLPDHDSTEISHRLEVDRLVEVVDALIWVVDPQKYADAALHDRYLRRLARHSEVMLVALNQADRLTRADRERCVKDLRRLLADDGLGEIGVVAVSAVTGFGLPELHTRLADLVASKQARAQRLAADVAVVAERLTGESGTAVPAEVGRHARDRLSAALADAAGVPAVVDAVGHAWRRRGALATGWPVLAWLSRFRPDPLRRLGLRQLGTTATADRKALPAAASVTARTSLPIPAGVQQARVETALRAYADAASEGLSRGWADALKSAARRHAGDLSDALDRAVASADLDLQRHQRWWGVVRVVQWLLLAAVVVGLGWLGVAAGLAYLQLPPLPPVTLLGFPLPPVLVVGGVIAGLLVAGLSRIGVEVGARRRSRLTRKVLRRAVAQVSADLVVGPVLAERERYDKVRAALAIARG